MKDKIILDLLEERIQYIEAMEKVHAKLQYWYDNSCGGTDIEFMQQMNYKTITQSIDILDCVMPGYRTLGVIDDND